MSAPERTRAALVAPARGCILVLLAGTLCGCGGPALVFEFDNNLESALPVPEQLDELCLQVFADGKQRFSRRYSLVERRGKQQSLTVIPGERKSVELLARGLRSGQITSEQRRSFETSGGVERFSLNLRGCSAESNGRSFTDTGLKVAQPNTTVATVPVANAAHEVLVFFSGKTSAFHLDSQGHKIEATTEAPKTTAKIAGILAVDHQMAGRSAQDCDLDLLALTSSGARLLAHDGAGHFSDASGPLSKQSGAQAAAAADFDNDGLTDLAVAGTKGLKIWLNNGRGSYRDGSSGLPSGLPTAISALAAGDLDGDFQPDLLIGTGSASAAKDVALLNKGGHASFTTVSVGGVTTKATRTVAVAVAELNNDKLDDIVVATVSGVSIYTHDGVGSTFKLRKTLALQGVKQIIASDVDRDCKRDLLMVRLAGSILYFNAGRGDFDAATSLNGLPTGGTNAAVADLDGNGLPDLLFGGASGGARFLLQR